MSTEGKREIVGLGLGSSEAETFWSAFLKGLPRRGLRGVKLVISDAHEGLKRVPLRWLTVGELGPAPFRSDGHAEEADDEGPLGRHVVGRHGAHLSLAQHRHGL